MKKLLFPLIGLAVLLLSCKSEPATSGATQETKTEKPINSQEIIALHSELDSLAQHGTLDRAKMQQFVSEAVEYANKIPSDTLSPHFLLYAGITQMQVAFTNEDRKQWESEATEAINILEKLRQNYPDYRHLDYAYYYKAQIYENLGKRKEAAKTYRDLAERYPDTELGKSAADYLRVGGYEKSAEEIMQSFKQ